MDDEGHRIDPGRDVLEGNVVVLKDRQKLTCEADLRVHHRLLDVDRTEILLTADTSDDEARLLQRILHDEGTMVLRTVRVLNLDRDALTAYREDRVLMQYTGTHVAQLTKLTVGDVIDDLRIRYDARICDEEAGYIRPVLVEINMLRRCNQGTGHIRTATTEGNDLALLIGTIEAREYGIINVLQCGADALFRLLIVTAPVLLEDETACRIDEAEAEIGRHQLRIQELTTRSRVVTVGTRLEILLDPVEVRRQTEVEPESIDDLLITILDRLERLLELLLICNRILETIEKIGYLRIAGSPLTRGRNHDIVSRLIGKNDVLYFSELFRGGAGASAKFCNLDHFVLPFKSGMFFGL